MFPLVTLNCIIIFSFLSFYITFSKEYPSSCIDLEDGDHYLRLSSDTSYPVVKQRCSNDYTILDYSKDNNLIHYFSTWDNWHLATSGPTNDEHVNWRSWYLPDSDTNEHYYLISPDCNTCDESANNQLFDTKTAYYMTGTIYGCFWYIKGQHNCDIDYDTLQCYSCSDILSQESVPITEDSNITDYQTTGICPTNLQSADYQVNEIHYDCTSSQSTQFNLKPSIGNSGQFCVCTKPVNGASNKGIDSKVITTSAIRQEAEKDTTLEVELYQTDFDKGTYRITQPGTYTIMEDIEFDFNSGDITDPQADGAWWPTSDQSDDYPGAGAFKDAYFMGFFAGITIETDDVTINLNGNTIKMSKYFYYQQRWFVTIEIGTQYFIPGQGLGNFGSNPVFPSNIVIKNGVIGLSSHHGIHGNNNKNIVLEDLVVKEFETHGIQFNGFETVEMTNIEVGPTSKEVYFKGEYAHMRALLPRLKLIAEETSGEEIQFYGRDTSTTMQDIADEIEYKMNLVWDYVVNDVTYDDDNSDWINAKHLFYNDGGLPYGGAIYGIFLNTYGASVFTYNLFSKEYSDRAILTNVKIHGIYHKMHEYIVIRDYDEPDIYINPLTAPLSYDQLFQDKDTMEYGGNIVTDAYLAMEYFSNNWYYLGAQVVGKDKLLKWALENDLSAVGITDDGNLELSCNTDVMIHSGKGINGLRLDGVKNVDITNLNIHNLVDKTPIGREDCGAYEDFAHHLKGESGGHFRQTLPMQKGFSGNMVQAIQLNAAKNINFNNINIFNLESEYGQTYGMAIWPENDITFDGNINIYNLNAGTKFDDDENDLNYTSLPNALPETCAIRIVDKYSGYFGTDFRVFDAIINQEDTADIRVSQISGKIGCVGLDIPSMLGSGTSLNSEDDYDDGDITDYSSYATYFSDELVGYNKKQSNHELNFFGPAVGKSESSKARKLSKEEHALIILCITAFVALFIITIYKCISNNKKHNNIEYTRLSTNTISYGTV